LLHAPAGDRAVLREVDAFLPRVELALLAPVGPPVGCSDRAGSGLALLAPDDPVGRRWYRHASLAPGVETGYDPLRLPEAVEAVRAGDRAGFDRALARLAAALDRAAAALEPTVRRRNTGETGW
jgi:hypothetical protein